MLHILRWILKILFDIIRVNTFVCKLQFKIIDSWLDFVYLYRPASYRWLFVSFCSNPFSFNCLLCFFLAEFALCHFVSKTTFVYWSLTQIVYRMVGMMWKLILYWVFEFNLGFFLCHYNFILWRYCNLWIIKIMHIVIIVTLWSLLSFLRLSIRMH